MTERIKLFLKIGVSILVLISIYSNFRLPVKNEMMSETIKEDIKKAPELRVEQWIDSTGKSTSPIRLRQFEGKYKLIYCFQHWCPGCHSRGLPSLKKIVNAFEGNDKVVFLAVQTVFEGEHANTYDKIIETQKKYELAIPFGHDSGETRSTIMEDYQTGGTPWFILIDTDNNILFADFHINVEGAIEFLNEAIK